MVYLNDQQRQILRYIIVGGMTTFVSFGSYWGMYALIGIDVNIANVISIILAVLFAYVANKIIVFRSKRRSIKDVGIELIKFIMARSITMFMEVFGVALAINVFHFHALFAKGVISIIILISNYLLSHYLIFSQSEDKKRKDKYVEG